MATITLPETLDLEAVAPLREAFLTCRGEPITVDGANVKRLGGLCLQVLLSAAATWRTDGQTFALVSPSDDLSEGLLRFGAADPFSQAPELT